MDTQDFNKELLDYLYGEMSINEKKEFEEKLKEDSNLQKELDELSGVREELVNLRDKEVMEPFSTWSRSSGWLNKAQRRRVIVFKPVTAVAASLVILFMFGYLTNFSITVSDQGFYMGFGKQEPMSEQKYFTEEEVKALVSQEMQRNNDILLSKLSTQEENYNTKFASLKSEMMAGKNNLTRDDLEVYLSSNENKNAETVKEYLKLTSSQQQEYFKALLTQFNDYYKHQRDEDLAFIQSSLFEINQNQAIQKQEVDEAIASIYSTVNQKGN